MWRISSKSATSRRHTANSFDGPPQGLRCLSQLKPPRAAKAASSSKRRAGLPTGAQPLFRQPVDNPRILERLLQRHYAAVPKPDSRRKGEVDVKHGAFRLCSGGFVRLWPFELFTCCETFLGPSEVHASMLCISCFILLIGHRLKAPSCRLQQSIAYKAHDARQCRENS